MCNMLLIFILIKLSELSDRYLMVDPLNYFLFQERDVALW